MRKSLTSLLILLSLGACGSAQSKESSTLPASGSPSDTEPMQSNASGDDPRVSKSAGTEGGIVVLWPRITPADDKANETARLVHLELQEIARRVAPDAQIDVRPEPERVCPKDGCKGTSLGAVFVHRDGGCGVVALVGERGEAPVRLLPWAGEFRTRGDHAPFRQPPETHLTVVEYERCTSLGATLKKRSAEVEKALRQAAGK